MEASTRELLNDRINTLNNDAVNISPAQRIYRTVSDILVLVRVSALALLPPMDSHRWRNQEKMIKNEFSVQLSEECFNVCETLKTKIPGGNVEDLSESVRIILEDLEKCVDSQTATLSADHFEKFQADVQHQAESHGRGGRAKRRV